MSKGGKFMYKNKSRNGNCNICGENIANLRKAIKPKLSQNGLSKKLQLLGLDIDKNAIQRIESGKRFVTDIELKYFAEVFSTTSDALLKS